MNGKLVPLMAIATLAVAAPALAQDEGTDYEAIVRIMRECAKIGEVEARVACYDNTVATERLIASGAAPTRVQPSPPPPAPPAAAGAAVVASAQTPGGFGAESLPETRAARTSDDTELKVVEAERLEPGIYLLSLADGSQWRFVDAVPWSYDTPRAGSTIELSAAALGSFQMRFDSQRPVRIMRVR